MPAGASFNLLLCLGLGFSAGRAAAYRGGLNPAKGTALPGPFNFNVAKGEPFWLDVKMDPSSSHRSNDNSDWSPAPTLLGKGPTVSLRDLKKVYRPRGLRGLFQKEGSEALGGIDMELDLTNVVALVGQPDCGKSTLLKILAGLEDISEGEIRILPSSPVAYITRDRYPWGIHEDLRGLPIGEAVEGVVRQRFGAIGERGNRNVQMVADRILWMTELSHRVRETGRDLSGSDIKRMGIALALAESAGSLQPPIILVDEYMDREQQTVREREEMCLMRLHQYYGIGVVLTTHVLSSARFMCDLVVTLSRGKLEQISEPDKNAYLRLNLAEQYYRDQSNRLAHSDFDERVSEFMRPVDFLAGGSSTQALEPPEDASVTAATDPLFEVEVME